MRGLDDLIAGYGRFKRESYPGRRETYRALALEGQSPNIMVIGCCDSRVDPCAIFNAGPGELFVVRNVANLVPPYSTARGHHGTSAAIEFAVGSLGVAHIVVMGHAICGGVAALMNRAAGDECDRSNIGSWMSAAMPALEKTLESNLEVGSDAFTTALEMAVIRLSLENLKAYPVVRDAMASGSVDLHGAWFSIETGDLHLMDDKGGAFLPIQLPGI